VRGPLLALLLLVSASAAADEGHLAAGVRAFQAGRYDEALVELRMVEQGPDPPADLAFYLGPTLYKLGRYPEALLTFRRSSAPPDTLTDFYLGQTLYQLALYDQAREVFAGAAARGLGPRLDEAARRYLAVIDRLYAVAPGPATVDAYLDSGARLLARGDAALAVAYLDEARRAEARGRPHRHQEIVLGLGRAYLGVGDVGRARPLLLSLAAEEGPLAAQARALLTQPAP
jgi:tetratricopeptide (TPR) repeat protein